MAMILGLHFYLFFWPRQASYLFTKWQPTVLKKIEKSKISHRLIREKWNIKCVIRTSAYTDKATSLAPDIKNQIFLKPSI
jgi:hypothetical protein